MGRGTIGPVYKDKQKQEELHVQEPKYFQGVQTQERRSQSGDQPQTDRLSSYTDTAGDVSLMSGQQTESIQFDVTATNIHETANAQTLLNGEQLSEQATEQISQQENQLQQGAQQQTSRQENQLQQGAQQQTSQQENRLQQGTQQQEQHDRQTVQLSPAYQVFVSLNDELVADTDSASPEFQAVKTTFARLMEVMTAEHVIEKHQEDALFAARQAAVHYYNTHRGHRWSGKGQRRKDLINRIIDSVQEAIVSDETPELVKWHVLSRMLNDTSQEGFTTKKTIEFANAQAKKIAGHQNVDEYSYRCYVEIKKVGCEGVAKEQLYHIQEEKAKIKTGFHDDRAMEFFVPLYAVNGQGEPLTDEDRQKKEQGEAFFKSMQIEDINVRKPFLDRVLQQVLDVKVDRKMVDPNYILDHFSELYELSLTLWYYANLFRQDELNQQYYDQLPKSVKEQLLVRDEIVMPLVATLSFLQGIKNCSQSNKTLVSENKDSVKISTLGFVKEYIKKGHIQITEDEVDTDHVYLTEDGYTRPEANIDNTPQLRVEIGLLNLIEALQKVNYVNMNLQEELRKAQQA